MADDDDGLADRHAKLIEARLLLAWQYRRIAV